MKNKFKSRSGCRTCKARRLRCDEAIPGCKNCLSKHLICPGYQQRLQWSTKHEKSIEKKALGPSDFDKLVSAATQSIAKAKGKERDASKQPPAPAPQSDVETQAESAGSPDSAGRQASVPSVGRQASVPSVTAPPQPGTLVQESAPEGARVTGSDSSRSSPRTRPARAEEIELTLTQPVVDIPTFLIEHWFKTVCTSWSAFDSHANPYRVLTSALWSQSMPVYYALQAISAASLVDRLPHVMRESAMTAPRLATAAIKKELFAFSTGSGSSFPKELLVSLFCMSSSLCWMKSRELGLHFVRQARAVLKCLDPTKLDAEDQALLDFFNGCLIYEEMLRSVVSNDEVDFENMLSWPEPWPESGSKSSLVLAVPHAWTGVSSEVLRLFGKSITFCRRSRSLFQQNAGTTYRVLQRAMLDIAEARFMEEALLAIEIVDMDDASAYDELAVNARHLHDATEAYRLASLLQLYQTFPDLVASRIPSQVGPDGRVAWSAWVTPLSLHVASLLETIPPGSMSCIQPLLVLCAGSGLRFENTELHCESASDLELSVEPANATFDLVTLGSGISQMALRISRARQFLMDRLDWLELSLPSKPIGVARDLLRAIWTAYDEEMYTSRRTHWIDVMISNGLQSLFG